MTSSSSSSSSPLLPCRPSYFPPPSTPLPGLMQSPPLLITTIFNHAVRYYPHVEIVSRPPEVSLSSSPSPSFRYTNKSLSHRVYSLSSCLSQKYRITPGDIIATLSYNHHRHVECYYSIQCMGAVIHTINPRLSIEQIEYIIIHANDTIVMVDIQCVDVLRKVMERGNIGARRFVILTDTENYPTYHSQLSSASKFLSSSSSTPVTIDCYEQLLSEYHTTTPFPFPTFSDDTACALCYTSGTTGNPKGVLYSHRSLVMHTISMSLPNHVGIGDRDVILVIVPLFHVNGWGFPYAAAMNGSKLVLPGHHLDGGSLVKLIDEEKVTVSSAVPTVWLSLFQFMDKVNSESKQSKKYTLSSFNRVLIGGSAAPATMLERFLSMGIKPIHLWGMSELAPLGTLCHLMPNKHDHLPSKDKLKILSTVGRSMYGVEMRVINESTGEVLPHDGKSSGELQVKGMWVTKGYFRVGKDKKEATSWNDQCNVDSNGWFSTGDVVTIDAEGYVTICDRTKDVIKSGGEWISSIDLENIAMACEGVEEAAVIGVYHEKWQERPLLIVVRKNKTPMVTEKEILSFMKTKLPFWYVPDGVEFVTEIPHGPTGKISKLTLRKKFEKYKFKEQKEKEKEGEGEKEKKPQKQSKL